MFNSSLLNPSVQPGMILIGGSSRPKGGYLLCDGAAISRTVYANLFSVIGTTYGEGDGSTTFNLPNLSGGVVSGSVAGIDVSGLSLYQNGVFTVSNGSSGHVSQVFVDGHPSGGSGQKCLNTNGSFSSGEVVGYYSGIGVGGSATANLPRQMIKFYIKY